MEKVEETTTIWHIQNERQKLNVTKTFYRWTSTFFWYVAEKVALGSGETRTRVAGIRTQSDIHLHYRASTYYCSAGATIIYNLLTLQ